MPRFRNRWVRVVVGFALAFMIAGCAGKGTAAPALPAGPREVRGVWITNVDSTVLTSRERIAEAMDFLAAMNINVVYPVVWNKAQTLYPSAVMKERFGVEIDPIYAGRDPLADIIAEAHRHGIEVVPWFEYGFASSYNLGGGPLLKKEPGWAAVDPDGNLVKKNDFEWMNALDPEVQEFLASLILEVATNYDIDGIQGDDRLPAMPTLGGYDAKTVARYRAEFGKDPPRDIKDKQWVQWRADILTEFLTDLRTKVKAIDKNIVVSMSPSYYDWSLYEYLQDSKTWTDRDLIDSIHPQAYRYDFEKYAKVIDDIVANQFTAEQLPLLSPGVLIKSGKYRITWEFLEKCIAYNRSKGIMGEVHFFYEGLRMDGNELGLALGSGPYREPATLPYRQSTWRPGALYFEPEGGARDLAASESATYLIKVPKPATYDVYAEIPAREGKSRKAAYTLTNGATRAEAATIDQSDKFSTGWVKVGTMEFGGGKGEEAILRSLDEDGSRVAVAGKLMLLLNRRHSPNVAWN